MKHEHIPQIPAVRAESENIIVLENDFFTVRHDKKAGGAPVSLIFKNGSGNNFLEKPVSAHVTLKKDNRIIFFRQSCGTAETFSHTVSEDGVKIFTEGIFFDEEGNTIPVRYKQTFFYQAWGRVNVSLQIIIEKQGIRFGFLSYTYL